MARSRWLHALVLLGASASVGGCAARAGVYAGAETPVVFHEPPTLVYVDSNVWVVRHADYPVYYVDGYYWVYRDDVWYRSETWDGGWGRVDVVYVPRQIVYRDHYTYVNYGGGATARTRPAPRAPELRPASDYDQRWPAQPEARPPPPARTPGQMRPAPRTPPGHMQRPPPPGQMRPVEPRGRMRPAEPPARTSPPQRPPEAVRPAPPERARPEPPRAPPERARPEPPRVPPGQARKAPSKEGPPAAPPGRARQDENKKKQRGREKRERR